MPTDHGQNNETVILQSTAVKAPWEGIYSYQTRSNSSTIIYPPVHQLPEISKSAEEGFNKLFLPRAKNGCEVIARLPTPIAHSYCRASSLRNRQ